MVQIRLRPLVAENILKMVGAKRPTILPLRVTEAIPFPNGNPTIAADRLPRSGVGLLKPRDYQRRFRLKLAVCHIVVRQCDVERILPRDERNRDVIPACARVRVIRAAVIRRPVQIPRTLKIRDGIISAGLFADPKDRSDNVRLPRVTLDRRPGTGRDQDLRFHFEQRLLPQFHCVLREIPRRCVGRSGLLIPEEFRDASNRQTETNHEKSPHYKRRHLLSDHLLLGKPNLPTERVETSLQNEPLRQDGSSFTGFQPAFATLSCAFALPRSPSGYALPVRSSARQGLRSFSAAEGRRPRNLCAAEPSLISVPRLCDVL